MDYQINVSHFNNSNNNKNNNNNNKIIENIQMKVLQKKYNLMTKI